MRRKIGTIFFICLSGFWINTFAAQSVTQRSFTWTFDSDYVVGQFINGDWYVVENQAGKGVKIVGITPKDEDPTDAIDRHCSAVNVIPSVRQRYKSPLEARAEGSYVYYDRENNIAPRLPMVVPAASSILSVKSSAGSGGNAEKNFFDDAAVLTVLAAVPPPNSFRPPYAGADKKIRGDALGIRNGLLLNLNPTGYEPSVAGLLRDMDGVLIDTISQWPNTNLKSSTGGPPYGRDITRAVADSLLLLNIKGGDKALKDQLLIRLIQRGIDVFGCAKAGMVWTPNGGHQSGRKLFLMIAAKFLDDPEMLQYCDGKKYFIFQEDMQHWYVTSNDVVTPRSPATLSAYTPEMVGMPEWASNPVSEANKTGSDWGTGGYRFVNGSVNCGVVLAVTFMGWRQDWNWEAFFDYINLRYYPKESVSPATNVVIPIFYRALWSRENTVLPLAPSGLSVRG